VGLKNDLTQEVGSIFQDAWNVQTAQAVPDPKDLCLNSNHAKDLETATVLYADLDGSTWMVDNSEWELSAGVYKAFLRCAAAVIRSEGGTITAYDGDRVMAVFTGGTKNTDAVRCGLKINWAVKNIIQPALDAKYPRSNFKVAHTVGIDTSRLRAARIGVHGDNDLVWIGRAANYAAKLNDFPGPPTRITKTVYDKMKDSSKFGGTENKNMWTPYTWNAMNKLPIYCSTWWWRVD
jgi:class 3 adenylate cyclase